ncbi:hypothetical protein I302_104849 [Kwoniella bestiolae CBS 10118]|uniref:Uncharacterized protein n=1 Tax=Kwoniella bestiolae CBS 10118 TaxID=1296100 RepID=A0A1B9FRK5_9TREE|nr:hypothetical protein I302_09082 [Kwoniella bestiolae CBS 10118]OCF21404.1 hypothetical protein I302_09082 [Kwoniella bestiolae CBS 10118]
MQCLIDRPSSSASPSIYDKSAVLTRITEPSRPMPVSTVVTKPTFKKDVDRPSQDIQAEQQGKGADEGIKASRQEKGGSYSAVHTPQKDVQPPTLASLASPKNLSGKRKRSITHFEGIPISIFSEPTSPSPPSAMATRKISTSRKIRQLDMCFSKLGFGNTPNKEEDGLDGEGDGEMFSSKSTTPTSSARSSGSFVAIPSEGGKLEFGYGYGSGYGHGGIKTTSKKEQIPDRSEQEDEDEDDYSPHSDPELESDSDSDDEDDVVFLLSP